MFRLDVSLVGRKVRETHAEAKAGDERKGATTPYRDHRDVKGPVFGSDLCGHDRKVSNKHRKKRTKEQTGARPLKIGHGPLAVIYPESLLPKLKCARRKE